MVGKKSEESRRRTRPSHLLRSRSPISLSLCTSTPTRSNSNPADLPHPRPSSWAAQDLHRRRQTFLPRASVLSTNLWRLRFLQLQHVKGNEAGGGMAVARPRRRRGPRRTWTPLLTPPSVGWSPSLTDKLDNHLTSRGSTFFWFYKGFFVKCICINRQTLFPDRREYFVEQNRARTC